MNASACESRRHGVANLNSRRKALTASFALDSDEDALSHTSRTSDQSSDDVAVK